MVNLEMDQSDPLKKSLLYDFYSGNIPNKLFQMLTTVNKYIYTGTMTYV